ncbi:MAG: aminoacyl-tRNA deacylase [Deltaproteobacteria bacterium]|nr:aminoacyl-tRNA deacylase [Deltaproteobacteria bacterium]
MTDLYEFLDTHGVTYDRHDHPPVYTVEESKQLVPEIPGGKTKNLFLRDKKGTRHILLTVEQDKRVDLKRVSDVAESSKLSFGSAERLKQHLGIEPGSVSLLALFNDPDGQVEVFIDEELWQEEALLCHPLQNTSTLSIPREDMERFFEATGHSFRLVTVPVSENPTDH